MPEGIGLPIMRRNSTGSPLTRRHSSSETSRSKLRLSLKAVKDDEERADFDGYREQSTSQGKFGTLADLLKKK